MEIVSLNNLLLGLVDCPGYPGFLANVTSLAADVELYKSNANQQQCFLDGFKTRYCH